MTSKREHQPAKTPSIDLHGVAPHRVEAKLEQFLYDAFRSKARQVEIVTGRGASNRSGTPVLRGRVEAWIRKNKSRFNITQRQRTNRGGALLLQLKERSS